MQEQRTGVATRIRSEEPAAFPVHFCAYSLGFCLLDAGRKLVCLRDALELCRETINLIRFSPKQLHLFSRNLATSDAGVTLKPLSTTRWTACTAAIDAILKDYTILMKNMEEIHATMLDEYGLKASECGNSLENFNAVFGFRVAHIPFGATEQLSLLHQRKCFSLTECTFWIRLSEEAL